MDKSNHKLEETKQTYVLLAELIFLRTWRLSMICTPLVRILVSETVQHFHNLLALTYFKNSATSVLAQYLSDLYLCSHKFPDASLITYIQQISEIFLFNLKKKKLFPTFTLRAQKMQESPIHLCVVI